MTWKPDGRLTVTRRRGADIPIRMPGQREGEPEAYDGPPEDDGPRVEVSTISFRPFPTRSRGRGWVRAHPRAAAGALGVLALAGVLAFVLAPASAPAPAHAHSNSHGSGAGTVLFVLGLAAAISVAYGVSLRIHPWRKCWWCRGRGRHDDRLFKWAHGLCSHCGGSGRWPRLGVRLFRHDEYLKMRAKLNR